VADAGDRMQVSRRILDVAYRLDQLRAGEDRPAGVEPAASVSAAEDDVVPIESLQYDAVTIDEEDIVPIASLAPNSEPVIAGDDALEASFRTLERLQRERGSPVASLEGLFARSGPVASPGAASETVEIGSLCYRGRPALERAAAVRQSLAAELAGFADLATIRPLLQELLDLVPLALDES
jgi:hypothetical protein